MYDSSYTLRLAMSLINNLSEGVNNNIFIKHYGTFDFSEQEIKRAVNDSSDIRVLYHEFNNCEIQGAYAPILSWIKTIYDEDYKGIMTASELIDKCDVYSLQKSLFVNYIETGICEREEVVIYPEIDYEIIRFTQSIMNIFTFFSKSKKLVFLLKNINFSNDSVIRFICEYLKKSFSKACIIASYNQLDTKYALFSDSWMKLEHVIIEQNALYDIENSDDTTIEHINDTVTFDKEKIGEYRILFKNMLVTMAYRQAVVYESYIHEELLMSIDNKNRKQVFSILLYTALCATYIEEGDRAQELSNSIYTYIDPDYYPEYKTHCYYLSSYINMMHMNDNEAVAMAKKCIESIGDDVDDYRKFRAEIVLYKAFFCGWHDMFHKRIFGLDITETRLEIPEEFIDKMIKYGFYNTLAYFFIYAFDMDDKSMQKIAETMEVSGYFKKALDIAYKLDNMSFVASAYMKKILDYSIDDCRYHEYVTFLHRKRNEIVKNVKVFSLDEFRYDHLGYQCIIHERYEQAHLYFNDYLLWVYEQKRVDQIAETLYNMSNNAMAAGVYSDACKFLLTTIKIVEYMRVQSLCICKASKLYGMLALCYFYMDEEINCSLYVDKIERMVSHLLDSEDDKEFFTWDDELFLYYFLKAIMHKKNANISAAQLCFSKAEYHMKRSEDYMFFSYPVFAMEKADMYYEIGENKKADKIIDKCIEYCSRNGYVKRAMILSNKKNNNAHSFEEYSFELKDITFAQIIEQARRSEINVKRIARQRDITFLSDWQDIINKERNSTIQVTEDAMNSLKTMYKLDGILYFDIVDKKPHIVYCNEEAENGANNLESIYEFFKICDNFFATNRSEKVFTEYKPVIQFFDMSKIMVFIGVPLIDNEEISSVFIGYINTNDLYGYNDYMIDDEELEVIRFVLVQLKIGISKIQRRRELEKINQKLYEMAVKDQLTGLLNRQGFDRTLDEIYSDSVKKNVLLMYLDLDNFKYYNDTFGHDVGDIVLKKFAKVLLNATESTDIVVRYGGDEFIILLTDGDEDKGEKIAKIIAKELSGGFIAEIKEKSGLTVDIPQNKLLSCSIGISYKEKCKKEDINNILLKADEALYYIKDNMKGTCITWDDLHGK